MLSRVPDDRDDHRSDEEIACTDGLGERVERMHEDLADDGGHSGRDGERKERAAERPGAGGGSVTLRSAVAAQVAERHGQVEREQHDGHRNRGDDCRVSLRASRIAERHHRK